LLNKLIVLGDSHLNYTILDDASLMLLIAQSHSEALGELYDRYSRLVFSLALHIVGDQSVAEEITQDVFTSIWEKAASYQAERSKVSTWISSITRYRAIDVLRRWKARPEQHSISWDDSQVEMASHPENTTEQAELAMHAKAVRAAIASLPREQQEALALAYFKGYSHSEIAEYLGEPLGTVKTRIRTAMQKLRHLLMVDFEE
jgi:RNA polymerase sigma-70 factor (ECF subfamily)